MEAEARVEELRAYTQQEGITADREIARGFAYEGYENLREGNYERARDAFDLSRSFDPYLPQAQFGYAWSLLRSGRGVVTFINEYAKGIRLAWVRFSTDQVQISNFLVVAALAALCSALVASLVVIARCQGRARHDIYEMARRFLPDGASRVLAWAIFILPLLVWAGGVWLVLYWLTICFRHMRAPEKAVAVLLFVMIGLSPLGVTAAVDRFQACTDPETRVVISAMEAGYNPDTLRQLKQVVAAHADETEVHLLLGTAYAKADQLGEAFDEYQRVLNRNPSDVAALVDVGNVYFRLGEYGQAVNHYKEATQVQPDLASAYWNLYLAQTELLHFAEADASLARARALSPSVVGSLLARKKGDNGLTLLLEEQARLSEIKRELRLPRGRLAEETHVLANPLSLASGVGFVFALILSIGGRSNISAACLRCGRAYCPRCRAEAGKATYCARCVHLFLKKGGIKPEVRNEGLARLQRRDRATSAIRRILSIALPGAGQVMAGRILIGFPVMMGWVCAVMFLVSRDRLLLPQRVPVTDLPPPGLVIAIGLMAILWAVGNIASSRRPLVEMIDGA